MISPSLYYSFYGIPCDDSPKLQSTFNVYYYAGKLASKYFL